jgi:hypothetical protein
VRDEATRESKEESYRNRKQRKGFTSRAFLERRCDIPEGSLPRAGLWRS